MKTIYKYELLNLGVNEIEIPVCSEYLKVDAQRGVICLWALVDTEKRPTKVKLIVVGTGCDINSFSEEKDCQIFLTKVEGDVEHNNFISSLKRIK